MTFVRRMQIAFPTMRTFLDSILNTFRKYFNGSRSWGNGTASDRWTLAASNSSLGHSTVSAVPDNFGDENCWLQMRDWIYRLMVTATTITTACDCRMTMNGRRYPQLLRKSRPMVGRI
jgi:hypothetical protein